jgi:hypothetical protein
LLQAQKLSGVCIDPIELYASAIDTSDYVAQVAPLVRQHVATIGDLLDVGAGGGQLGSALSEPGRCWTAIEPNPNMRARLAEFDRAPRLVPKGWETADVRLRGHDTVLAANISALLQEPNEFLARCQSWARRTVVWVVPAQAGPRGLCYAGCLPADWHGEDETPGIDIVLRALAPASQPHAVAMAQWTFSGVISDLDVLATYLSDRLGWASSDGRRGALGAHLAGQAKPDPAGVRLKIPRKSAVLVWGASCVSGVCVSSA